MRKKKKNQKADNTGQEHPCQACGVYTCWFVTPLASIEPEAHYIICLDCYKENSWQAKVVTKETIMKDGSSNGWKSWDSQPKDNHCQDHLEENTQVTSSGNSDSANWWWK